MYRFRLGKKTVGDNLITNGDFPANLNNWLCGGAGCPANGWTQAVVAGSGAAQYTGACGDLLSQNAVFTPGVNYRISYDIISVGALGSIGLFVGDYGKEYDVAPLVWTTIVKDRVCLAGVDIAFKPLRQGTSVNIDNVTVYELDWNDLLEDEPIGWEDSKISVKRDKAMKGLFKKYITELIFKGDGYTYLREQYEDSICNEVPILIEYQCEEDGDWTEVFEGVIYVADITWDLVRCQAHTEIDDRSASALIRNGKNIKTYFNFAHTCGGSSDILIDSLQLTDFHVMATGLYPVFPALRNQAYLYNVGLLFRRIIHNTTDVQVEFESDLFETGTYRYFAIGIGEEFAFHLGTDPQNAMLSFKELFDEMDKIFNISFLIYYPNGVPTIKIEEKPDFYNAGVLLTLENVPNLEYKLDKSILYRTVDIGYKKFYDTATLQPSEYDEGFHYEIAGTCFDLHLDLVCKYIQDSTAIDMMFTPPGITEYYSDYFVVECWDNAGTIETRQFNIGGVFYFNQNINQDDNMLRWVWSMPSHAILQTDTTVIIAKPNVPLLLTWDFKFPISWAELNTVLADTTQQIRFGSEADNIENRDGYIDELTFEVKSGRTTFKLITT